MQIQPNVSTLGSSLVSRAFSSLDKESGGAGFASLLRQNQASQQQPAHAPTPVPAPPVAPPAPQPQPQTQSTAATQNKTNESSAQKPTQKPAQTAQTSDSDASDGANAATAAGSTAESAQQGATTDVGKNVARAKSRSADNAGSSKTASADKTDATESKAADRAAAAKDKTKDADAQTAAGNATDPALAPLPTAIPTLDLPAAARGTEAGGDAKDEASGRSFADSLVAKRDAGSDAQNVGAAADAAAAVRADQNIPQPDSGFAAELAEQRVGESSDARQSTRSSGVDGTSTATGVNAAAFGAAPAMGTAAVPQQVDVPTPVNAPDFAQSLGVQVSVLAKDGVQHAELHLNPGDMGPVSVQITMEGTQARVDFGADVAATRHAIEAGLPQLASALADAGFTLAGGGVSQHAGSRGDGGNSANAGGNGGQGSDGSRRSSSVDASEAASRVVRRTVSAGGVDTYA